MHNLDGFDKILKEKLEQQHYAYDPSLWNAIEKELPPPKKGMPWKFIAAASVVVAGGILAWQLAGSDTEQLAETNLPDNPEKSAMVDNTTRTDNNANTDVTNDLNPVESDDPIVVRDHVVTGSSDITEKEDPKTNNHGNQKPNDDELASPTGPDNTNKVKVDPPIDDKVVNNTNEPTGIKVPTPSAQFSLSKTTVCAGTSLSFTALNKVENTDYLWDFGDGSFSKLKSPNHSFTEAGTYYVSLEARSSVDNSIVSKSDKIAIIVNPVPSTDFSWEENTYDAIPSVQLINRTNNAVKWSWDLGNGEVSHEKDPVVTYKKKGFYTITLTATNIEGCAKASQQEIEVATDYNLLAPNSFTPDADGINDVFIPEALKILDVNFEMTIYDRRGLIYQSRSLNDPWTGLNQRDGGMCPQGAYVWIVKYKDHEGIDQVYKGTINLLK